MTRRIADILSDMIEAGCRDESILIEALMCFIETESHVDLIPAISSRLPEAQFTDDYWNRKSRKHWNPVFAAVMHCSCIEVFRALRDAHYPVFPVADLRLYPDPEGFLEIIAMDMPDGTDEAMLYEIAVKRITAPYMGREGYEDGMSGDEIFGLANRDSFYLSSFSDIPGAMFDEILSGFIAYGRDRFGEKIRSSVLFPFFHLICLNTALKRSWEVLLSWPGGNRMASMFTRSEKAFLLGASIWAGNEATYGFLLPLFSSPEDETILEDTEVLFNGRSEYIISFIGKLADGGPLRRREAVTGSISASLASFPFGSCPSLSTLSFLFGRLRKVSSSDFPEPLTAVLVRNRAFRFYHDEERKVLEFLTEHLPHDLCMMDGNGMNAFLYASDDGDLLRYIISKEPGIVWSRDREGRNIFHHFLMSHEEDDSFRSSAFHDLSEAVPPELLAERDVQGRLPSDHLPFAGLLRKAVMGEAFDDERIDDIAEMVLERHAAAFRELAE